jgi:hypothetical protein
VGRLKFLRPRKVRKDTGPRKRGGQPKKVSGAAKIAQQLQKYGMGGMGRASSAVIQAVDVEERSPEAPMTPRLPSEADVAAVVSPLGYEGQRLNRQARLTPQAAPLLGRAVPPQPLPWELGHRDWAAIAEHIALSVGLALGKPRADVLAVDAGQLRGPLRFNRRGAGGCSAPPPTLTTTRHGDAERAAAQLQRQADGSDVLLLHDEMDALVVTCTTAVARSLREHLAKEGHACAMAALSTAAALPDDEALLEWLRTRPCPNRGSSHTGITVDFGLHDAQQGAGADDGGAGIPAVLRGGNSHVQVPTANDDGLLLAPSTAKVREEAYQSHRRHVEWQKGRRGKPFELLGVTRIGEDSTADTGKWARMPCARADHSFPRVHDLAHMRAATMEETLRGAAADVSVAYFSAVPGVQALLMVQRELREAERALKTPEGGCPFEGGSSHLYPKGSMGLMATKRGHDDRNGPACATCWQNLGSAGSGARLELVVVVHGHEVVVEAECGHIALFAAWLPHLTRVAADGPEPWASDWRLHHTAYCRFGTEYFAWVARAYRLAKRRMPVHRIGRA